MNQYVPTRACIFLLTSIILSCFVVLSAEGYSPDTAPSSGPLRKAKYILRGTIGNEDIIFETDDKEEFEREKIRWLKMQAKINDGVVFPDEITGKKEKTVVPIDTDASTFLMIAALVIVLLIVGLFIAKTVIEASTPKQKSDKIDEAES